MPRDREDARDRRDERHDRQERRERRERAERRDKPERRDRSERREKTERDILRGQEMSFHQAQEGARKTLAASDKRREREARGIRDFGRDTDIDYNVSDVDISRSTPRLAESREEKEEIMVPTDPITPITQEVDSASAARTTGTLGEEGLSEEEIAKRKKRKLRFVSRDTSHEDPLGRAFRRI